MPPDEVKYFSNLLKAQKLLIQRSSRSIATCCAMFNSLILLTDIDVHTV